MSKPTAVMDFMLRERLQKMRRCIGRGLAHTSSDHIGCSSPSEGGGGGKLAAVLNRSRGSGGHGPGELPLPLELERSVAAWRGLRRQRGGGGGRGAGPYRAATADTAAHARGPLSASHLPPGRTGD